MATLVDQGQFGDNASSTTIATSLNNFHAVGTKILIAVGCSGSTAPTTVAVSGATGTQTLVGTAVTGTTPCWVYEITLTNTRAGGTSVTATWGAGQTRRWIKFLSFGTAETLDVSAINTAGNASSLSLTSGTVGAGAVAVVCFYGTGTGTQNPQPALTADTGYTAGTAVHSTAAGGAGTRSGHSQYKLASVSGSQVVAGAFSGATMPIVGVIVVLKTTANQAGEATVTSGEHTNTIIGVPGRVWTPTTVLGETSLVVVGHADRPGHPTTILGRTNLTAVGTQQRVSGPLLISGESSLSASGSAIGDEFVDGFDDGTILDWAVGGPIAINASAKEEGFYGVRASLNQVAAIHRSISSSDTGTLGMWFRIDSVTVNTGDIDVFFLGTGGGSYLAGVYLGWTGAFLELRLAHASGVEPSGFVPNANQWYWVEIERVANLSLRMQVKNSNKNRTTLYTTPTPVVGATGATPHDEIWVGNTTSATGVTVLGDYDTVRSTKKSKFQTPPFDFATPVLTRGETTLSCTGTARGPTYVQTISGETSVSLTGSQHRVAMALLISGSATVELLGSGTGGTSVRAVLPFLPWSLSQSPPTPNGTTIIAVDQSMEGTSNSLATRLQGSTSRTFVITEAGDYDHTAAVTPGTHHVVWCDASLERGDVRLKFGLNLGGNTWDASAELHGFTLDIEDSAKLAIGRSEIHIWKGTSAQGQTTLADLDFDGNNGFADYGLLALHTDLLSIERCAGVDHALDGCRISDNNPFSTSTLTRCRDLYFTGSYRRVPPPGGPPTSGCCGDTSPGGTTSPYARGSSDGTGEFGIWIGHKCLEDIDRLYSGNNGWGGVWFGNAFYGRWTQYVRNITVPSSHGRSPFVAPTFPFTGTGIYCEHTCQDVIFENGELGRDLVTGIAFEWDKYGTSDFAINARNITVQNYAIRTWYHTENSWRVGVFADRGTLSLLIKDSLIEGYTYAGVANQSGEPPVSLGGVDNVTLSNVTFIPGWATAPDWTYLHPNGTPRVIPGALPVTVSGSSTLTAAPPHLASTATVRGETTLSILGVPGAVGNEDSMNPVRGESTLRIIGRLGFGNSGPLLVSGSTTVSISGTPVVSFPDVPTIEIRGDLETVINLEGDLVTTLEIP